MDTNVECALLWKLSRLHGRSTEVTVSDLVRRANVKPGDGARAVARENLPSYPFVGRHPGRDTVWIEVPVDDALFYYLRDERGYSELQIEATFDSYFDGF